MSKAITDLAGLRLASPTVLASGILGLTASSALMVAEAGAGAITLKSCGLEPRAGHKCPSVLPWEHGLINAVGLSNPGVAMVAEEIAAYRQTCAVPVIASIFGKTVEEFGLVAHQIAQAQPDLIEVNVSCPNVESEFGVPFGLDLDITRRIIALVKSQSKDIPVSIKLSPNCAVIGRFARACQDEGADAITAINTVGPGMLIDINTATPVLSKVVGGLSGPAIMPVALRCVYDIYREVSIPIIGTGGITTADDAIRMLMAGATALGIGSAVYYRDLAVFAEINQGLERFLAIRGLDSTSQLTGMAHG